MKIERFEKAGKAWERVILDGGKTVVERLASNGDAPPSPPPVVEEAVEEVAEEAPVKSKKGK